MSIRVSELSKVYGKQKALDTINFEVSSGEVVGFLGPNGAGKSTTMKIITSYIRATSGQVWVQGQEVGANPKEVRHNIGYLPEHNPLYLDMFVREYLNFIAELHQIPARERKKRVAHMIGLCGLEREQTKKIAALSKGYRQRVGLAQALIHNPPVLILDEPTTGLDPNQIVEIRQVIKDVGQEKTVLFSTHIMQEVQAICDRAIIINLGKIVADRSVKELQAGSGQSQVLILEFSADIPVDVLTGHPAIQKVSQLKKGTYRVSGESKQDLREEIFQLIREQNWNMLGMQKEENSLESIFQQLTAEAGDT